LQDTAASRQRQEQLLEVLHGEEQEAHMEVEAHVEEEDGVEDDDEEGEGAGQGEASSMSSTC
jgi:hypothetical protein